MIPLLYQLSYTAPGKIRGLRYWIMRGLSREKPEVFERFESFKEFVSR